MFTVTFVLAIAIFLAICSDYNKIEIQQTVYGYCFLLDLFNDHSLSILFQQEIHQHREENSTGSDFMWTLKRKSLSIL